MTITVLSLIFGALVLTWLLLSALVGREVRIGRRVVLAGVRAWLDSVILRVGHVVSVAIDYVDRHVIRLSWYYSLHSFLQAALRVVVSLYEYLERWFHHNRMRARALRAEKRGVKKPRENTADTHLSDLVEHKEATALSEREKQKLRTKKLERE